MLTVAAAGLVLVPPVMLLTLMLMGFWSRSPGADELNAEVGAVGRRNHHVGADRLQGGLHRRGKGRGVVRRAAGIERQRRGRLAVPRQGEVHAGGIAGKAQNIQRIGAADRQAAVGM